MKISNAQLIDETTNGLNFLSQKLESKEYQGGIIGPAASSLFLTILVIHSDYKNVKPAENNLLKDFYRFSSKTIDNDFELIGCMRHSLAHSDFGFELDYLTFESAKFGTLKIPYAYVTALANTMFSIYNKLKANLN